MKDNQCETSVKNTRGIIIIITRGAHHLVKYSGPFAKWTWELHPMDLKTKNLMTIHKTLNPWDEVNRLHVSRKKGKGLASIQDSFDASIQWLGARRTTGYSHQKQYRQYKHQHNKNNQETKMGSKITVGTFKVTISEFSNEKNWS